MVSGRRKLTCPHPKCGFSTWNADAVAKHADQEHGRCGICGRSILQQFLNRHQQTHGE